MDERELWRHAAVSYEAAGVLAEAARCYAEATAFARAAELYERVAMWEQAVDMHTMNGSTHCAAWISVHHLGDAARARRLLATGVPEGAELLGRTAEARCLLADGDHDAVLSALTDLREYLASNGSRVHPSRDVQAWAVTVAEAIRRYDQVALIFAAAVRGGRPGAEEQWQAWAAEHLGARLVLPERASGE